MTRIEKYMLSALRRISKLRLKRVEQLVAKMDTRAMEVVTVADIEFEDTEPTASEALLLEALRSILTVKVATCEEYAYQVYEIATSALKNYTQFADTKEN